MLAATVRGSRCHTVTRCQQNTVVCLRSFQTSLLGIECGSDTFGKSGNPQHKAPYFYEIVLILHVKLHFNSIQHVTKKVSEMVCGSGRDLGRNNITHTKLGSLKCVYPYSTCKNVLRRCCSAEVLSLASCPTLNIFHPSLHCILG